MQQQLFRDIDFIGRELQPTEVEGQDGSHELSVRQSQAENKAAAFGRSWSHHQNEAIFSRETKLMEDGERCVRIEVF